MHDNWYKSSSFWLNHCPFYFRSDLAIGEEVMDSLAPFIVLKGQDINVSLCEETATLDHSLFNIDYHDMTNWAVHLNAK